MLEIVNFTQRADALHVRSPLLSMGGQEPPIQWGADIFWMAGPCPAMVSVEYLIVLERVTN